MKKKLLTLTLVFVMILTGCGGKTGGDNSSNGKVDSLKLIERPEDPYDWPEEPTPETDFVFNENFNAIEEYTGDNPVVVVPETINGSPVLEIMHGAFTGKNVTHVKLPEGLLAITGGFNECTTLEHVYLPDTLESLAVILSIRPSLRM